MRVCTPLIVFALLALSSRVGAAHEGTAPADPWLGATIGGLIGSTIGQGDGRKVATAVGAVIGAIAINHLSRVILPARCMVIFCAGWYVALLMFSHMGGLAPAVAAMVFTGCMQSLGMVAMSALLLRTASGPLRSRVMGLRMLMIYGLPIGLMAVGPLITLLGFHATVWLYCVSGIALTAYIAWRWRTHLWHRDAPANRR